MSALQVTELEALIDVHGVQTVLQMMATICHEKAEHLRGNWQDESSARAWDHAGVTCDNAASSVTV